MVKITGIGWRLKFYFFLDFVVPINSMLQHPSPPPASLGHLTIVCAQEVDIWKKGILKGGVFECYPGEAGNLNQNCKVLPME